MPDTAARTRPPDPRDPFVLDTRELGRRAGALQTRTWQVPAPDGLGDDVIGVRAGVPLDLAVRLESVTEGVLVTGTATVAVHGECGRCLDAIDATQVAEVVELFAYPNSTTDETTQEDEVSRIVDDLIDLRPAVHDAVILALPTTPLCRPDCRGLCPECGTRWDDLPNDHSHDVLDPRWAALGSLRDGLVTGGGT